MPILIDFPTCHLVTPQLVPHRLRLYQQVVRRLHIEPTAGQKPDPMVLRQVVQYDVLIAHLIQFLKKGQLLLREPLLHKFAPGAVRRLAVFRVHHPSTSGGSIIPQRVLTQPAPIPYIRAPYQPTSPFLFRAGVQIDRNLVRHILSALSPYRLLQLLRDPKRILLRHLHLICRNGF